MAQIHDQLLVQITDKGWTMALREDFVRQFDRPIGRGIVGKMGELQLISDAKTMWHLRQYAQTRLRSETREPSVESCILETIEAVYVAIYKDVFKGTIVQRFIEGQREGKISKSFLQYLYGVIHNKLLDHISQGPSERQLLNSLIELKQPKAIERSIARLMGRYWEKTRSYLVCCNLHRTKLELSIEQRVQQNIIPITHYFFEVFILAAYPTVKDTLQSGESALMSLLQQFQKQFRKEPISQAAINYKGKITPVKDFTDFIQSPDDVNEDQWLDYAKAGNADDL